MKNLEVVGVDNLKDSVKNEINELLNFYPLKINKENRFYHALANLDTGLKIKHSRLNFLLHPFDKNHYYKTVIHTEHSRVVILYHFDYVKHTGVIDHQTKAQGLIFEGVNYARRQIDKIKINCSNHHVHVCDSENWLETKILNHNKAWLKKVLGEEEQELNLCLHTTQLLAQWQSDKEDFSQHLNASLSDKILLGLMIKADSQIQQQRLYQCLKIKHGTYDLQNLNQALDKMYEKCLNNFYKKERWLLKKAQINSSLSDNQE